MTPDPLGRHRLDLLEVPETDRLDLDRSDSVARLLLRVLTRDHRAGELTGGLFVDAEARPLGLTRPSPDDRRGLVAEPRRLLAPGLLIGAAGLILFQIRSRCDLTPTDHDLETTARVRAAGEVVGVRLVDHLLIGDGECWASLRDAGRARFHALGEEVSLPLLAAASPQVDRRRRVEPKYVNPDVPSQTWSGRGRQARWLQEKISAGARLEDFLVGK